MAGLEELPFITVSRLKISSSGLSPRLIRVLLASLSLLYHALARIRPREEEEDAGTRVTPPPGPASCLAAEPCAPRRKACDVQHLSTRAEWGKAKHAAG